MKKIHLNIFTLFLFLIFAASTSCKKKETEVKPEVQKLTEAVYASGYIRPKNEYQIISMAEGYLYKKIVSEGAEVNNGDPMFLISAEQQDVRMQNAQQVYQLARSNYENNSPVLQEINAALNSAKNKLHNDSINFNRYKNLLAENATSQVEYDRAKLAYQNSQNDYRMQKQRYEKTKRQLLLEMQNAQSQLNLAAEDKGNYVLKSNIKGMVYQTYKEEGELVRRGEQVALVGEKGNLYLQLNVDELDISKVKVGQEIVVKIDVYKDKIFNAKITKVYPMFNRKEQAFRVDAEFTDSLPFNFTGLSVEANIVIREKENALTIPKIYLVGQDSVWVKKDGKEQKIKIEKGIETMDRVEVVSGLDKNSELVVE